MNKVISPLSVSVIGLLFGIAAGLAWFWVRADSAVSIALARAKFAKPATARSKGWDFWTVEVDNLAAELKEEKANVKKEGDDLDQRAARIASDRQDLEKLRSELDATQKQISDRVVEIQSNESKNLRMLAQTYTNLSPHAAVEIIRELDDATAVKILSLMKPDVVGPIFEDMAQSDPSSGDAKKAAILSEKLRLVKEQPSSGS